MSRVRCLLIALAAGLVMAGAAVAEGPLQLNEVLADPPAEGGDANGDGVRDSSDDEFIEIVNLGTVAVDLAGWSLRDSADVRHVFAATPPLVVPPGGMVTVFGGGDPRGIEGIVVTASSGRLQLNNTGDVVTLADPHGITADRLEYGSEGGRDLALGRVPDGRGPWVLAGEAGSLAPYSPGRWNRGTTGASPTTWGALKIRVSTAVPAQSPRRGSR